METRESIIAEIRFQKSVLNRDDPHAYTSDIETLLALIEALVNLIPEGPSLL